MTPACHLRRMPRRKKEEDFNTQIHALYERIAGGESSHDDEPPAEPAPTPEKTEKPKKADKVFDPTVSPAQWLGQRGGKKGGKARTDAMTAEQRKELAQKAAAARWATAKTGDRKGNG